MENRENSLRRLRTVEGHLRGVIRMVEQDEYCIDVIRQIQAVEAALNKVSSQILENHLNSCVTTAIQGNNLKERERVLERDHRSLRDVDKGLGEPDGHGPDQYAGRRLEKNFPERHCTVHHCCFRHIRCDHHRTAGGLESRAERHS